MIFPLTRKVCAVWCIIDMHCLFIFFSRESSATVRSKIRRFTSVNIHLVSRAVRGWKTYLWVTLVVFIIKGMTGMSIQCWCFVSFDEDTFYSSRCFYYFCEWSFYQCSAHFVSNSPKILIWSIRHISKFCRDCITSLFSPIAPANCIARLNFSETDQKRCNWMIYCSMWL